MSPYLALVEAACEHNEVPYMARAISVAEQLDESDAAHLRVLSYGCQSAIKYHSLVVLTYLLDQGAIIKDMPICCSRNTSKPILEFLLEYGWDINTRKLRTGVSREHLGPDELQPFLWHVAPNREMVVWCLEHGASVIPKDQEPLKNDFEIMTLEHRDICQDALIDCPPILERVACSGHVDTFKLLKDKGAPLGWRTLHRAVWRAALESLYKGTRLKNLEKEVHIAKERRFERQMAMVRFLKDELGIDVNAPDQPKGRILPGHQGRPPHLGTPLCYVTELSEPETEQDMTEIITFLLDREADPNPALAIAKYYQDQSVGYYQDQGHDPSHFVEVHNIWQARQRHRARTRCCIQ